MGAIKDHRPTRFGRNEPPERANTGLSMECSGCRDKKYWNTKEKNNEQAGTQNLKKASTKLLMG